MQSTKTRLSIPFAAIQPRHHHSADTVLNCWSKVSHIEMHTSFRPFMPKVQNLLFLQIETLFQKSAGSLKNLLAKTKCFSLLTGDIWAFFRAVRACIVGGSLSKFCKAINPNRLQNIQFFTIGSFWRPSRKWFWHDGVGWI